VWQVRTASPRKCHALGSAAVNVRAIAQGASEHNISVVIDGRSRRKTLRRVSAEP